MLQIHHLSKSFGDHRVLTIPKRSVPAGIYRLRGVNGSGKSTLLNILAGLLPFEGDIILNGNCSLRKQPVSYRSRVNHAPAEPVYPSFVSGYSLLRFVQAIKKGDTEQAEDIKKALGIGDYLANPTGSYSSGMLKKLSILLAFTGQPDWILLDEPFTTVDQASQQALVALIRSRHEQGVSFIITSHHDSDIDLPFHATFTVKDQQLLEQ